MLAEHHKLYISFCAVVKLNITIYCIIICYYYLIYFPSMQCHVCDSDSGNTYIYMYFCFMTDQLSIVYFNHTITRLLGI